MKNVEEMLKIKQNKNQIALGMVSASDKKEIWTLHLG